MRAEAKHRGFLHSWMRVRAITWFCRLLRPDLSADTGSRRSRCNRSKAYHRIHVHTSSLSLPTLPTRRPYLHLSMLLATRNFQSLSLLHCMAVQMAGCAICEVTHCQGGGWGRRVTRATTGVCKASYIGLPVATMGDMQCPLLHLELITSRPTLVTTVLKNFIRNQTLKNFSYLHPLVLPLPGK